MKSKKSLKKNIQIALLGSLGTLLMLWQIPYPGAPMLQFDLSLIPVLVGGFALGPLAGLGVLFIKNILFLLLKFSPHELIGIPMNLIASSIFLVISSSFYYKHKTWKRALGGIIIGIIASTLAMVPANFFILPLFIKWFTPGISVPSKNFLVNSIVYFVIPFNLLSGLLNGSLTFFVYKKLADFIRTDKGIDIKKIHKDIAKL